MAGEFGQVGTAWVRIRADLRGLPAEINSGVRKAFAGAGEFSTPTLGRAGRQLDQLGVSATRAGNEVVAASRRTRAAQDQAARDSVAANLRQERALLSQVEAYRAVAAAATQGSRTQVAANRLAAESAQALGIQLTAVEAKSVTATASLGALERGAIAGSGAFRGLGRNVAFASLGFIGAYGLVGFLRQAIEQTSELNNQTTRSVTVFGGQAGAIQGFAKDATKSLSLADETALRMADDFGTVFRAAQVAGTENVKFSSDLVKVAAALSLARGESDPSGAEQALRVALAGRGRALRQYGIILDDTALKQKAIQLGLVPQKIDQGAVALDTRKVAEAQAELLGVQAKFPANSVQVARAQDAVTVAERALKKDAAGTTGELTRQAKAVAAHAIIMEQGKRFVDRYGDSLDTAAGRSRRFHEGVDELKDEIGQALYPSFTKAVEGINSYLTSIEEGGSRHAQFESDLHDLSSAAHDTYSALSLVAAGVRTVTETLGGFGSTLEILGLTYLGSKLFKVASGFTAVATEAEVAAGTTGGLALALKRLPAFIPISIIVAIEYELFKHKQGFLDFTQKLKDEVGRHVREPILKYTGFTALTGVHDSSYYRPGSQTSGSRQKAGDRYKQIRDAGNGPLGARNQMRDEGWSTQEIQSAEARYALTSGHGLTTLGGGPDPEGVHSQIHARDAFREKATTDTAKKAGADTAAAYNASIVSGLKSGLTSIRSQLADVNREISEAASDNAKAMADAVKQAAEAERAAILGAKSNLLTLGSDLASKIGELLDKQGESIAPTGPLAKRLAALNKLIHEGQATPALIREAQRVEHELNSQNLRGPDGDRKERVQRRLADLTAEFDSGKISLRKFNREVTALLRSEGVSYKAAGKALGFSFAQGFRVALEELRQQAGAIAATPASLRRQGTGFETNVVKPLEVIREQNQNIADLASSQRRNMTNLIRRRHELLLEEQKTAHQLARAQGKNLIQAVKDSGGSGGAKGGGGAASSNAAGKGTPAARPAKQDLMSELLAAVSDQTTHATKERQQLLRAERRVADAVSSTGAAAHDQRSVIILQEKAQTRVLHQIERHTNRSNETLATVEKHLRRPKPKPRSGARTRADEARAAGVNNLA